MNFQSKILIALALFGLVVVALESTPQTRAQFLKFIKKYDKHYESKHETDIRYQNFLRSLERIHAKKGKFGAEYGINKYSDWSADEIRSKKSAVILTPEAFAKSCLANNVTATHHSYDDSAKPPKSFDWRSKGVVTPVKNQGQCGSCWTFSTTGNIESQYAISGKPLTNFSEQMIVDCSTACILEEGQSVCNQGCNGGWPFSAMSDIMTWGGLEEETAYPYTAETGTCKFQKNKKHPELYAPLSGYTCVGTNETEMMLYMFDNGPLSIALNADLVEDYSSGIIIPNAETDDDDGCDPQSLDHAVLIVGYGTAEQDKKQVPFWTVKNSWGADWGEEGYFRIIRGVGACGLNNAVTCAQLDA